VTEKNNVIKRFQIIPHDIVCALIDTMSNANVKNIYRRRRIIMSKSSNRRRRWQKKIIVIGLPCRMQLRTVQFSDVAWKWWW